MLVQYWKNFAEAEFFNIDQRIRKEIESREETTEEAEYTTAQGQEEDQIRAFGASFAPSFNIKSVYASYGLNFAHNIYTLLVVKTARINECLQNQTPSRTATPLSHTRNTKRNYEAFEHEISDRRMIQQAKVDALQR